MNFKVSVQKCKIVCKQLFSWDQSSWQQTIQGRTFTNTVFVVFTWFDEYVFLSSDFVLVFQPINF